LRANDLDYVVDGTIVRIAPVDVFTAEDEKRKQRSEKRADAQAAAEPLGMLKHQLSYANGEEIKKIYELIVVGVYDYKTNEELEDAKRYWQDRLAGANLKFSAIGLSGGRSAYSMGIPKALVPTDRRMAVPDLTYPNGPCHRPLIRMIIQYDGEVANCCEDMHGSFKLGNVHHQSLEELWFSERHVRLIEDLIEGRREKYSLCRDCPLSPTGPAREGTKIDIIPRRYAPEISGAL
jgi:radical SAM protein with 4Fe4S-binding SPASM domain